MGVEMSRRGLILGACLAAAPGLAFAAPRTAMVDGVQVLKGQRKLQLLGGGRVLKTYPVALGFRPQGAKRFEGDGRTPEGTYVLTGAVRDSDFHHSMRVSYPGPADVAFARKHRKDPGGDICVHGQPNGVRKPMAGDWTWGCVAMSNADVAEFMRAVPAGTPIRLFA